MHTPGKFEPMKQDRSNAPDADAPPEPIAAVLASAGLRYTLDHEPGIARRGAAPKFKYVDARGRVVRDTATLGRIRRLAIPPAWTDVWICSTDRGHIQATGRDAKGRKQYRYHPTWQQHREAQKFGHLLAFGEALRPVGTAGGADAVGG